MIARSIKQEYKQLWKTGVIFFLIMFVVAIGSFIAKDYLPMIQEIAIEWPREALAFCGLSNVYAMHEGLLTFYLVLILVHMVAMAMCVVSGDIMNRDEEEGITIFYLNQPYTKTQIFFLRLISFLGSVLIRWALYIGAMATALYFLCDKLGVAFEKEWGNIYIIAVRGLPFLFFAATLTVLYSMLEVRNMNYRDFIFSFCILSYIVGNAYKVTDYVAYHLRSLQEDATAITQISKNLKQFRSVYPFTLLNVLNTEKKPLSEDIYLIYIGIGVLLILVSWLIYARKNFE